MDNRLLESQDSWREWSKYVLGEIIRLSDNDNKKLEKIQDLTIELKTLKVKFTLYMTVMVFVVNLIIQVALKFIN